MDDERDPMNEPELSKEERRRRANKEHQRRWRENNPERIAHYRRTYRQRARAKDPEKWLSNHREEARRYGRRRRQRLKRNAYNRRRYAENIERSREKSRLYQRRYIARQKALDPEGFRERKNAAQRQWYANNRARLAERGRERYREDPEKQRAKSRTYFEMNQERVRERRRKYYRNNREAVLAANRQYKARERRRREAGLPPRRLHRVSPEERARNQAAADEFFNRPLSPERRKELERTPPELIARWEQETARLRAVHGYPADEPLRERVQREREARRLMWQQRAEAGTNERVAAEAAENARLDAIARTINDRLRKHPRTHTQPRPLHPYPNQQTRGL